MCIPTLRKSKKIHEDKFHTVQVTVASPLSSPYPSTAAGGVKMETFQNSSFGKLFLFFSPYTNFASKAGSHQLSLRLPRKGCKMKEQAEGARKRNKKGEAKYCSLASRQKLRLGSRRGQSGPSQPRVNISGCMYARISNLFLSLFLHRFRQQWKTRVCFNAGMLFREFQ